MVHSLCCVLPSCPVLLHLLYPCGCELGAKIKPVWCGMPRMVMAKQIQGLTCSFITAVLSSEAVGAGIYLALTLLEQIWGQGEVWCWRAHLPAVRRGPKSSPVPTCMGNLCASALCCGSMLYHRMQFLLRPALAKVFPPSVGFPASHLHISH